MSSIRSKILERIHRESVYDIYFKLHPRPLLPTFYLDALDEPVRLRNESSSVELTTGSLIEFYGPSGSGKTSFLLHLLCTYITPPYVEVPDHGPVEVFGLGRNVLFMDLDVRLDTVRLHTLLQHHFMRCLEAHGEIDTAPYIGEALRRLYVVRPTDPFAFLHFLRCFTSPPWSAPRVHLIVIDALSQMLWPLKQCLGFPHETLLSHIHTCLRQCQRNGITCLFTTWPTAAPSGTFHVDLRYRLTPFSRDKEATHVECILTHPATLHSVPRYVGIHAEGLFDVELQSSSNTDNEHPRDE